MTTNPNPTIDFSPADAPSPRGPRPYNRHNSGTGTDGMLRCRAPRWLPERLEAKTRAQVKLPGELLREAVLREVQRMEPCDCNTRQDRREVPA